HDHLVDDVDDAVGGVDVGADDGGVVDLHCACSRAVDGDGGALHCRRGQFLAGDGGRHHFSREHVVGEDGGELVLVLGLQQVLDRAGGERSKGGVGGGEDGEGTGATQRLFEAGSLDGGDERVELT